MTEGIGVRVRVGGRVGPYLCELLSGLDVDALPRHTVITVGPDDLHALLVELGRRGIEVEQITR